MTRSKAWVRVLGVGERMDDLIGEYRRIREREFRLEFKYPTEEQRKKLKLINREKPGQKPGRRKKANVENIDSFLNLLETGELDLDQLSRVQRDRLEQVLRSRK